MSQKTKTSSEEKESKKKAGDSLIYKNILICKCGQFHEFKLKFQKNHILIFPCGNMKLSEMNALKDFHEKCFDCKKEIFIERDYYYKNNTNKKTLFICNTCREKNKSYKKYNLISEKKDKEDNFRNSIKDKFTYFIENNGKLPENEFYVNNLSQFQLFGKFVDYLCVIRELYSEENKKYKIFSQFINYSENLIDIANKNINIYDLYHFNEETIIYSYCNDKKTRFLSFDFKSNYEELLDNCTKNKYLSIQMLKYIYKKYEEMNLVNYLELDLMETKYFQIKEINIGKTIFLKAS